MPKRSESAPSESVSTTSPKPQPSADKPVPTGTKIAAAALRGIKTLFQLTGLFFQKTSKMAGDQLNAFEFWHPSAVWLNVTHPLLEEFPLIPWAFLASLPSLSVVPKVRLCFSTSQTPRHQLTHRQRPGRCLRKLGIQGSKRRTEKTTTASAQFPLKNPWSSHLERVLYLSFHSSRIGS